MYRWSRENPYLDRAFYCHYLDMSIAAVISAEKHQAVVFLSIYRQSTGRLRIEHWDRNSWKVFKKKKKYINQEIIIKKKYYNNKGLLMRLLNI